MWYVLQNNIVNGLLVDVEPYLHCCLETAGTHVHIHLLCLCSSSYSASSASLWVRTLSQCAWLVSRPDECLAHETSALFGQRGQKQLAVP